MESPSAAIRARDVTKRYGDLLAVDHVDFEVRRGECYGFLGPNGAGKTSTMKMLYGLSPISEGSLEVLGYDVRSQSRAIRERTGVVTQEDSLDPDFTALENLLIYASYFGIRRRDARARGLELLEHVGLSDKRAARVPTLSGGMRRRLVLARALVHGPELLLLDEPTTGLDPQARHVMWQTLRGLLAKGATMVLTTHYMEEAAQLCTRLCVMDRGRILIEGTPDELVRQHATPEVVEVRLGNQSDAERVRSLLGDSSIDRSGDTMFVYCQDGAAVVRRVEAAGLSYLRRSGNLEDVFLRLTGRELRSSQ